MNRKIYGFCNLIHTPFDEYTIQNHPIIAVDDQGIPVGRWVSSNHSFGQDDILRSLKEIEYPFDFEWVEDVDSHPIKQLLNGQ